MSVLPVSFYTRKDVVKIARELLGKWLFTKIDGHPVTGGMIIETEAYGGAQDRACHAYNMRRTKRTEVMFHRGGISYVYFCYGIHYLLNIVTNVEEVPHAILIRAILPEVGIETMLQRRGKASLNARFTAGPGSTAEALGITRAHNGLSLASSELWIEDRRMVVREEEIFAGPRIGVEYAQEDALLPWRFLLKRDL
jgi:DNA-3-methyladenine glycosylase